MAEGKDEKDPSGAQQPDVETQIKNARDGVTKAIYTRMDSVLQDMGFDKNEGESTFDAFKRMSGMYSELKSSNSDETISNKAKELAEKMSGASNEEIKVLYEAKLKEQTSNYDDLKKQHDDLMMKHESDRLNRSIESSLTDKNILVPSSLKDTEKAKYRESIKLGIINDIKGVKTKEIEGKSYFVVEGELMMKEGNPMTMSELIDLRHGHLLSIADNRHPTPETIEVVGEKEAKKIIKKRAGVKTKADLHRIASEEHEVNTPAWAAKVLELSTLYGIPWK